MNTSPRVETSGRQVGRAGAWGTTWGVKPIRDTTAFG